jgi:hypothetical protein
MREGGNLPFISTTAGQFPRRYTSKKKTRFLKISLPEPTQVEM